MGQKAWFGKLYSGYKFPVKILSFYHASIQIPKTQYNNIINSIKSETNRFPLNHKYFQSDLFYKCSIKIY